MEKEYILDVWYLKFREIRIFCHNSYHNIIFMLIYFIEEKWRSAPILLRSLFTQTPPEVLNLQTSGLTAFYIVCEQYTYISSFCCYVLMSGT
jgi:hypothetical protein